MAARTARISRRISVSVAVVAVAALLAGCADGVEINSPLLNSLGVATGAIGQKEEPKLKPRAPLVMPPSTERLPEPGQAPPAAVATADPAWPKDKDQERVAAAAQKKAQQAQYCREGNWKERAMDGGREGGQGGIIGPHGSCNTILDAVGGLFNGGNSSDN
jgi:hypothetical protein